MQQICDTYSSIEAFSEGLFKDNGSRFIALAYPVQSEAEVKPILDEVRKQYHDARHHCFAYRIGLGGEVWRASDDGEPSGSAGRQILGQIDSAGLSDILVIVVRYFGGIKLGIPGLIRAYKTSTADALQGAVKVQKVAGSWWTVAFDYSQMQAVMKVVKDLSLPQRAQNFGAQCTLQVRVRLCQKGDFLQRLEGFSLTEQK